jgi:tetratricopeptide (TPR) repeat protein
MSVEEAVRRARERVPQGVTGTFHRPKSAVISDLVSKVIGQKAVDKLIEAMGPWGPTIVVAGFFGLFFGITLALLLVGGESDDERLSKIKGGQAHSVLNDIEKIPPEKMTGIDHLYRGHALYKTLRPKKAMEAYKKALNRGASDAFALENLVLMLKNPDFPMARELLTDWPNKDVEKRLDEVLDHREFDYRHSALRVLDSRDSATVLHRERVALRDLLDSEKCEQRRLGLTALEQVGKGEEVLAAVQAAKARMPDNLCMSVDLVRAEEAIKRRQ